MQSAISVNMKHLSKDFNATKSQRSFKCQLVLKKKFLSSQKTFQCDMHNDEIGIVPALRLLTSKFDNNKK